MFATSLDLVSENGKKIVDFQSAQFLNRSLGINRGICQYPYRDQLYGQSMKLRRRSIAAYENKTEHCNEVEDLRI